MSKAIVRRAAVSVTAQKLDGLGWKPRDLWVVGDVQPSTYILGSVALVSSFTFPPTEGQMAFAAHQPQTSTVTAEGVADRSGGELSRAEPLLPEREKVAVGDRV
jgi:hypothetical protein